MCDVNIRSDMCKICGAAWSASRKNKAVSCPSCGSEKWDEGMSKEVNREWITKEFGDDVVKLSKAIRMNIDEAAMILAHYFGESAVSISRRTNVAFNEVMDMIKNARHKLQRLI